MNQGISLPEGSMPTSRAEGAAGPLECAAIERVLVAVLLHAVQRHRPYHSVETVHLPPSFRVQRRDTLSEEKRVVISKWNCIFSRGELCAWPRPSIHSEAIKPSMSPRKKQKARDTLHESLKNNVMSSRSPRLPTRCRHCKTDWHTMGGQSY